MNIVICDDNELFGRLLQKDIQEYFAEKENLDYKLEVFTSGEELIEKSPDIDIIFLDILLGKMNGIEVAKKLIEKNKDIIIFIVTNYERYMDDAMDAKIYRFFPKPVEKKRLFSNLSKAIMKYQEIKNEENKEEKFLVIKTNKGIEKILIYNIILVEKTERKLTLYTTEGEYSVSGEIEHLMEEINNNDFIRTCRGCIINVNYVYKIDNNDIYLRYNNKEFKGYVSRRNKKELKNKICDTITSLTKKTTVRARDIDKTGSI